MPERWRSGEDTTRDDGAPIDYDVVDRIGQRLVSNERFEDVEFRPTYAPDSLVAEFDRGYFPAAIECTFIHVRWFENDDFNVHYREDYENGDQWECRWDRHPNSHNARDHFHPPPDAQTPGRDERYPTDWRDVMTNVLTEIDARVRAFWDQ